ncbi:hypothetical protein ZRA01_20660 [Zoogloea ramigera]|uniref:Uncharacterized protein n=1 Tax=Zoogloea ramigera TaxID=350 RepID=A0A4Y4CXI5_ZOORA|nr:hypothetical protein ZRA01_20660 [Zoogloea ramigera]
MIILETTAGCRPARPNRRPPLPHWCAALRASRFHCITLLIDKLRAGFTRAVQIARRATIHAAAVEPISPLALTGWEC